MQSVQKTVSWKPQSSKYVVFPERQLFFAFWGVRGAGHRLVLGQRLLCIRLLSSCQYDGRKCHSHRWWEWHFFCKKSVDPYKKNPKLQGEATKNVFFHLELRSPMFGERSFSVFYQKINGIDKIKGGFMYKVDYKKSSKIMFKLSMPQRAPKRRSPNIGERRSK